MNLDLRLSLPVAMAWLVAVFLIGVPSLAIGATIVLWLAAGAASATAVLSRRPLMASVALACALAALCSTSVAVQTESRQPAALSELAARHAPVEVWGTTTSAVTGDADYFQAQLSSLIVDGQSVALSSPALIFRDSDRFGGNASGDSTASDATASEQTAHEPTTNESAASVQWGIGVEFSVAATLTATGPGDGRAVLVFASEDPVWRADPSASIEWANQLRHTFASAVRVLPGGGGELLGGLAIGDTSAVSEELDAAMKTSSLSHLTAVSGANCAIVVGLIMALGGRLGAHRVLRIGLSVLVLLAFVVVVTPDPSVLRAALMATLVLIALASGRPMRGMAVLSLAAISLLVFDPWLSRNFAFALSVSQRRGCCSSPSRWLSYSGGGCRAGWRLLSPCRWRHNLPASRSCCCCSPPCPPTG